MEPRIPDAECAGGRRCRDGRWICSQGHHWRSGDGSAWGAEDTEAARLTYLATMTAEEHEHLADIAHGHLNDGYWQGFETTNGGYEDGPPWNDAEARWRLAARDFMARRAEGERHLTEGMLMGASYDLCRELAWVRGWCPANQDSLRLGGPGPSPSRS